ncbi:MAG TPA: bacillithiol biosynthesis deacetylase BshB1 [Candidatus Polarisedimenticolaceae bacterium]|nr:bacillithiol biosynthesis deacetylase BshB1 [Candidatus Polarisedimenticolaceae bacterium]
MSTFGIDVLAFGAHPDDVELFCGGIMIRLADLGYATGVVDLTRGELATHGSVEARAVEAEAAARVLGVTVRDNLGLPDGGLVDAADGDAVRRIVGALRRHRPELVLAPWIEERHPDHVAAGKLLQRCVFLSGLRRFDPASGDRFSPRRLLHYPMRLRPRPSFVVDTTAAWERKLEAIACHASQVASTTGEALAAIEATDRYHGTLIGTRFGEALLSVETLGVSDPVALLR